MKNLFLNILCLLFCNLLVNLYLNGQELQNPWNNVIPPSPTAASLGKYVDIPVGHYTGTPNIDIPIYELPGNNVKVPISLSYHASGIKVEEIASWVGLGWSLNAGGVISRTRIGKADDDGSGYMTSCNLLPIPNFDYSDFYAWNPSFEQQILLANGRTDLQPDIFTYNFMGKTGKFVIYKDKCYPIPYQGLDIKYTIDSDFGNFGIISWTIIDEDGIEYVFGKSNDNRRAYEKTDPDNGCADANFDYISSWYLLEINAFGDRVFFDYKESVEKHDVRTAKTKTYFDHSTGESGNDCNISQTNCNITATVSPSVKLERIRFNNVGTIEFESAEGREDMRKGLGLFLNSIIFKDVADNVIKSFELKHSYYNQDDANFWDKRLKLDELVEYNSDKSESKSHIFEYNSSKLPPRNSKDKDHWGFYNAAGNSTELPTFRHPRTGHLYSGADKESNSLVQKNGILEKIIYPTGGYTEFIYEANDYGRIKNTTINELAEKDVTFEREVNCLTGTPKVNDGDTETFMFSSHRSQWVRVTVERETDVSGEPVDASIKINDHYISDGASEFLMPKGKSMVTMTVGPHNRAEITIRHKWADPSEPIKNKKSGGLRIKRIISSDGGAKSKDIIREYTYRNSNEPDRSSGILVGPPPEYYRSVVKAIIGAANPINPNNPFPAVVAKCFSYEVSSESIYEICTTQGSHIAYTEVEEKIISDHNEGRTQFKYSYVTDDAIYVYPYPPVVSNDWRRGLLKKKTIFNSKNDTVLVEENEYELLTASRDPHRVLIPAAKAGWVLQGTNETDSEIKLEKYNYQSAWFYLKKTILKEIPNTDQDPIVSTTEYFYDNPRHIQPTRITKNKSDGEIVEINYKYPFDYKFSECEDEYNSCLDEKYETYTTCYQERIDCEANLPIRCDNNRVACLTEYNRLLELYTTRETNYQTCLLNYSYLNQDNLPQTTEQFCNNLYPPIPFPENNCQSIYSECINSSECIDAYHECFDPDDFTCETEYAQCETLHRNSSSDDNVENLFLMQDDHMLTKKVEYEKWFSDVNGSSKRLVEAKYHQYQIKNPGNSFRRFNLEKIKGIQSLKPIAGYISTHIDGANKLIFNNNYNDELIFDNYDDFGKPREYHTPNGTFTTIIWGYSNRYPIAKIEGIESNSVPTSVQEDVYKLINATTLSEIKLINKRIRENLPENCQITTYTYQPLVGIKTISDVGGKTTIYDYDKFGRLIMVKDDEGNILESLKYNYRIE